jgi:hypothetical protein
MNKEFVPYQQALDLKELGFDEPCFGYYVSVEVPNPFLVITKISDTQGGYFTFAPLYQQAFRWFREKYNLEGIPQHAEDRLWYKFHISTYLEYGKKNIYAGFEYPTYEKAEYACLNKLIEIVKNK